MDTKKIGRFITELRKEQQMPQSQLAEQIHVTDKAISKWERGAGLPDISMLEPLADELPKKVTVTFELLAYQEWYRMK